MIGCIGFSDSFLIVPESKALPLYILNAGAHVVSMEVSEGRGGHGVGWVNHL